MGRQSFTLKYTAIGGEVLLEIPRNHLVVLEKIIFYSASFSVEELNEIREIKFESERLLHVRFKKLSTNQNRGIA